MRQSKQNTIRNLRREVRHLRSLLKAKDRLLSAQKSFYEEMNRFNKYPILTPTPMLPTAKSSSILAKQTTNTQEVFCMRK